MAVAFGVLPNGETIEEGIAIAYAAINCIQFEGCITGEILAEVKEHGRGVLREGVWEIGKFFHTRPLSLKHLFLPNKLLVFSC